MYAIQIKSLLDKEKRFLDFLHEKFLGDYIYSNKQKKERYKSGSIGINLPLNPLKNTKAHPLPLITISTLHFCLDNETFREEAHTLNNPGG